MTTLPQTTGARLPRPATNGMQLAGPTGGPLGHAGAAASQQGTNEVWRVIRSHIWMILIVTCLLAPILGGVAYYLLGRYAPRYTATGLVQVQPPVNPKDVRELNMTPGDPANVALEARTQVQLLKSESLLTKVLQDVNSGVRNTSWFKQFNDVRKAKADFEDNLSVSALTDTKLVRVDFTYSDPGDCKTLVYELVTRHLEDQKKSQQDTLLDRTAMLNNVKIKAEMRLKDLNLDMKEKQVRLNTDGGGINRVGVKEMELSKLVQEQVEAQLLAGKAKAIYDTTFEAIQKGQDPAGVDMYVQRMAPGMFQDKYNLTQMEMELALTTQQYGKDNPKTQQMIKRVDMMRSAYQISMDEARAKAKVAILEDLQQQATAESGKLESLSKRVDNLKQDLGDLSNAMVTYFNLQDEQRGLTAQIKQVKEQIENVMAFDEHDFRGACVVVEHA